MDIRTRELASILHNGYCKECNEPATEIHHMISNNIQNRRRFPLFVNSIFNLIPLCYDCHHNKPLQKIREHEAEIFERWLTMFKGGAI